VCPPDIWRPAGAQTRPLLADVLGVDLGPAAEAKLAAAHGRYPAAEVTGRRPDRR
jgi:hypothetical protein